MIRRGLFPVGLIVALLWVTACAAPRQLSPVDHDLLLTLPAELISFEREVKPILERRCVVCHGCYDAPCQLKLSSFEGLERGANKHKVYDGARIVPTELTRLFVDGQSTAEWRSKGFYSVLNEGEPDPGENLRRSVLYRMLRLKRTNPQPRDGMLPDTFDLGLDRRQECPDLETFDAFAEKYPGWGMPYAMPDLTDAEYRTLVQWLAQGAQKSTSAVSPRAAMPQVERWEVFLNGSSRKQKLVGRYLYEHLFQAHLHFAGTPPREFYRLVRSRTPAGAPVAEIATVRPYDDPGAEFYYRLHPYHPSIVAKDHVVYELSDRRMERFRELFLTPEYEVAELPSYRPEIAANPLKVFAIIPPVSRYRFLLDDARFFIEGFIKGPVCRGQVALDVIEDRFWVFFFDPDRGSFTVAPDFLDRMVDDLTLPADRRNTLNLLGVWTDYWRHEKRYMKAKEGYFEKVHAEDIDVAMSHIWDGEGRNPNAALTIFRHFDSASVTFGLVGDYPETAWIIDYPMFERIHYLLVAGFNVYGNIGHQLSTRLYMDFLRMEGEDHFLSFLPADKRKAIRDAWYEGLHHQVEVLFHEPMEWLQVESVVDYRTDDPQRELYGHLQRRLAPVVGGGDFLSPRSSGSFRDPNAGEAGARADRAMREIVAINGPHLEIFPDVTFLRVKTGDPQADLAYTLIHNKGYKNLTTIFEDEDRRDRRDDTLTVVRGLEGSYPNFFLAVELEEVEEFASRYAAIRSHEDYERFVTLYGIRRTHTRFWEAADWFHDRYRREKPVLSGLFDLNRYRNR